MQAYAICDTGHGQHAPQPMLDRIYPTRAAAEGARDSWLPEDMHRHYPIYPITINLEAGTWQPESKQARLNFTARQTASSTPCSAAATAES